METTLVAWQLGEIPDYNSAFWANLMMSEEKLLGSISALCAVRGYWEDPRDVLHDVALVALSRWPEYQRARSDFKTWFIWIARGHLQKLMRGSNPMALSLSYEPDDGLPLYETIPDESNHVEFDIIAGDTAMAIHRYIFALPDYNRKSQVLRAMATLIDGGERLSTRRIAEIVGLSHTTVAKILQEIREDLQSLDISL